MVKFIHAQNLPSHVQYILQVTKSVVVLLVCAIAVFVCTLCVLCVFCTCIMWSSLVISTAS